MIKKTIISSITVIIIAALSVGVGFLIDGIYDGIDRKNHPREYAEYVTKYSSAYGVPEYIVYAVIKTESDFDSSAVSGAGAIGLMQLMPSTFSELCGLLGDDYEEGMLYDPETNIKYGTYYLSYLYGIYARWPTVYAAYNAGMGTVDKWLLDSKYSNDRMSLHTIPYEETRNFVASVTVAAELYTKLYYSTTK